jgi:hypothetical protein
MVLIPSISILLYIFLWVLLMVLLVFLEHYFMIMLLFVFASHVAPVLHLSHHFVDYMAVPAEDTYSGVDLD